MIETHGFGETVAMSVFEIAPPTRLGPESNGMRLSPEEYDAVTEWEPGFRYELVNGVLVVNPPPSPGERDPNEELGFWIRTFQATHPSGAAVDLTLFEQELETLPNRRRADRVIWTGLGRIPDARIDVPTIAIEFVSESSRDRRRDYVDKRDEYARIGVREYWVIDRFDRTMTVCLADGTDRVVTESETYTTDLMPGFELPLARLLAVADRWTR